MGPFDQQSNGQRILLAVNAALFVLTLFVTSAVVIILMDSNQNDAQAKSAAIAKIDEEITEKYASLLQTAKSALDQRETELQAIRSKLKHGYVEFKDIKVTERNTAYWLSEPKLMLGVRSLSGGQLSVTFGQHSAFISVGERIDFKVEDCDCYLLLKSSLRGQADFRFACAPGTKDDNPILEARLN